MLEENKLLGELIFTFTNKEGRLCKKKRKMYAQNSDDEGQCVKIGSTQFFIADVTTDHVEIVARCAYKTAEESKLEKAALIMDVLNDPKPLPTELDIVIKELKSFHENKFVDSTMVTYYNIDIAARVRPFLYGYVRLEYVLAENHVFPYGPSDSTSTKIHECDYPDRNEDKNDKCGWVQRRIVIVSGRRCSGKTTFIRKMFPGYKQVSMLKRDFANCTESTLPPGDCVIELQGDIKTAPPVPQNSGFPREDVFKIFVDSGSDFSSFNEISTSEWS